MFEFFGSTTFGSGLNLPLAITLLVISLIFLAAALWCAVSWTRRRMVRDK